MKGKNKEDRILPGDSREKRKYITVYRKGSRGQRGEKAIKKDFWLSKRRRRKRKGEKWANDCQALEHRGEYF